MAEVRWVAECEQLKRGGLRWEEEEEEVKSECTKKKRGQSVARGGGEGVEKRGSEDERREVESR